MIRINLLPHREAARKRRQEVFNLSLAASALAGGLIAGLIYLWLQGQIDAQEQRNALLRQEIQRLDVQIKDIATLEGEIAALRARQQAVENLQADRNTPVYLLGELTHQIPDGVYINSVKQDGQVVDMQGSAQSQERVSELLRNLAYNSLWFTKPELLEIVGASLPGGVVGKDPRKIFNFSVRARLLRASEVQKPLGADKAAVAPVAGASAAMAATPAKP